MLKEAPVPGKTVLRRYSPTSMDEEIGIVTCVRIQRNSAGDVTNWSAMVVGENGYEPFGMHDKVTDCYRWHPTDWILDAVRKRVSPPVPVEEAVAEEPAEDPAKETVDFTVLLAAMQADADARISAIAQRLADLQSQVTVEAVEVPDAEEPVGDPDDDLVIGVEADVPDEEPTKSRGRSRK